MALSECVLTLNALLLSDAEGRENGPQHRVARGLARDLTERLVRLTEFLGHELEGGAFGEPPFGDFEQALRPRECVEVPAPCGPGAALRLVARGGFQLLAQLRQSRA